MTQPTNVASLLEWPGENLTLSLLGSSLRTLSVPMNQPPFKASRRVRTTLIQHGTLEVRGVPLGSHALHRLGLPSLHANHAVSRWRRKPCRTVLIPLSQQTRVPALPVRVGVVPSSHTTKSLTGGVQNTSEYGTLASVQYVPFPLVWSGSVEVTQS